VILCESKQPDGRAVILLGITELDLVTLRKVGTMDLTKASGAEGKAMESHIFMFYSPTHEAALELVRQAQGITQEQVDAAMSPKVAKVLAAEKRAAEAASSLRDAHEELREAVQDPHCGCPNCTAERIAKARSTREHVANARNN
jgi:hypothetical protein